MFILCIIIIIFCFFLTMRFIEFLLTKKKSKNKPTTLCEFSESKRQRKTTNKMV